MSHLNHKGPEEKGPRKGRKPGFCKSKNDVSPIKIPGKGMGKRRRIESVDRHGDEKRLRAHDLKN